MKRIAVVGLMLMLLVGVSYAGDTVLKKDAGDYTVTLKTETGNFAVGKNKVIIQVSDSSGKTVTPQKVEVSYTMPEQKVATGKTPEMLPMHKEASISAKGSVYKGVLDISMPGPWDVNIKIIKDGRSSTARFLINVE